MVAGPPNHVSKNHLKKNTAEQGISFESLYGGHFTLSTQLIKPKYFLN